MGVLTRSVAERWNRFWFPEVPLERLAVVRFAVTLFALIDVTLISNYMWQYTTTDPRFYQPIVSFRVLSLPPPSPLGYGIVLGVMVAALTASVVGYRTRLALMVAAPLYLYHWSLFNSWGKVNHGKIPVVLALFVLAAAPAGSRLALDAMRRRRVRQRARWAVSAQQQRQIAGWALRVVGMVIVLAYMISVVAKLRGSGLGWGLLPILERRLATSDRAFDAFLAEQGMWFSIGQYIVLTAEALAFLAFFKDWRRNVLLLILGVFHISSYLLIETEFSGFLICYLVFFRVERLLDHLPLARLPAGLQAWIGPNSRAAPVLSP